MVDALSLIHPVARSWWALPPFVVSLSPFVVSLSPFVVSLSPFVVSLSNHQPYETPPRTDEPGTVIFTGFLR